MTEDIAVQRGERASWPGAHIEAPVALESLEGDHDRIEIVVRRVTTTR